MAKKRIRLLTVLSVLLPLSAIGSAGVSYFFWHRMHERGSTVSRAAPEARPAAADPAAFIRGFDGFLLESLAEFGITEKDVRRGKSGSSEFAATESRSVTVPASASFTLMHLKLAEAAGKRGATIRSAVESPDGAAMTVSFAAGTVVLKKSTGKKKPPGAVAIVIAGAGDRSTGGLKALCLMEPAVTLAVSPFRGHTADAAKLAAGTGAGLLLYLSFDAAAMGRNAEKDVIQPTDSDAAVRKKLTRMFDDVPGASGLMLEESSGFDGAERALEAIMIALRGLGKFHLGGNMAARSGGCAAAGRLWVKTAGVDGFIDDGANPSEISAAIRALAGKTAEGGVVVIAGLDHPSVVDAFIREIPLLRARGVRFVRVSDVAR